MATTHSAPRRFRSPITNDRHRSDDEHSAIRRAGRLTLCKLRDSITRDQALSRSWVAAIGLPRSRRPPPPSMTSPSPPSSTTTTTTMALTDLPYTIFAEIITYLTPREAIAARRVSRPVHAALTRPELSITLLLQHFPRALETRELKSLLSRDVTTALEAIRWADALAATARRYHHLGAATPRATHTVPVARDDGLLRGVTPWNRFLRLEETTTAFHYWDPVWTCDAAAGLLVLPVAGRRYVLRDVETGGTWAVPFETEGRLVRRVRLSCGVLVFEWCEARAMREGEEEEGDAHRQHFATAYDVRRVSGSGEDLYTLRRYGTDSEARNECTVTFRAQWEIIHSLGILLRHQDRFFSAHNRTHYAVYLWMPSRSPWGEDEPVERLLIWDLTPPTPRMTTLLTGRELDHWGVRQRGAPALRGLALDDAGGHVFLVEEDHRWSAGPHSSPTPARLHHVKTTGIPLAGVGPRWVDECGKVRPGDAAIQMHFCQRRDDDEVDGSETTWEGRCPCWRHDDFPYLTVCEVRDVPAGVRFTAKHCFMLETLAGHIPPRLRVHGVPRGASLSAKMAKTSSSGSKGAEMVNGAGHDRKASEGGSSSVTAGSENRSDGLAVAIREGQFFRDDAWPMLLNAGYICGDERWLIGENGHGSITIMHF